MPALGTAPLFSVRQGWRARRGGDVKGDLEEVGGGGRVVLGNVARPAVNGMLYKMMWRIKKNKKNLLFEHCSYFLWVFKVHMYKPSTLSALQQKDVSCPKIILL